jgi:hypothetical protein
MQKSARATERRETRVNEREQPRERESQNGERDYHPFTSPPAQLTHPVRIRRRRKERKEVARAKEPMKESERESKRDREREYEGRRGRKRTSNNERMKDHDDDR